MSDRVWLGTALAVKQVDTITLSGTGDWVAADTITCTINGNDLVLTVGDTNLTDADVAEALSSAINATSALDGTASSGNNATSNVGGQEIPEFKEVVATQSSNVVTVTARTAGIPFTMTVTESTSGDEVATESTATAATGPSFASNADNWSGGAVPVNSDDVIFDDRAKSDCLYGLDLSSVTLTSLTITNGFTQKIGLPPLNGSGTSQYAEYRDRYLQVSATNVEVSGSGQGSGRLHLDVGSNAATIDIDASGSPESRVRPAILLLGTSSSNILRVTGGSVGVAFYEDESSHLATLHVEGSQTSVVCGEGVDLADATITQNDGSLSTNSANGSGTVVIEGGTLTLRSGAHAAVTVNGGTVDYESSGTITTLNVTKGGTCNLSKNVSRTVTNVNVYEGSTLTGLQSKLTLTNGIDFEQCNWDTASVDLGKNFTATLSAV